MDRNCARQYIIDPVSDKRLEGKGFVYAAVICRDFLASITTSWAFTFGIIRHSCSWENYMWQEKHKEVRRRNENRKQSYCGTRTDSMMTGGRNELESEEAPDDKNIHGESFQLIPGSRGTLLFSEGKLICNTWVKGKYKNIIPWTGEAVFAF